MPKKQFIKIERQDFCFMAIFAFRYALGRMSAAPTMAANWILSNLDAFNVNTLQQFVEDVEDAEKVDMLGHECDRTAWLKFAEDVKRHIAGREGLG